MILMLHLLACAWMTGIIWIIQRVHYPMFRALPETDFRHWMNFHTRRIGLIVGPTMLIEVATGLALLYWPSPHLPLPFAFLNIGFIALIFVATAVISIPAHRSLALNGRNEPIIQSLVRFNWIRTALWTTRLLGLGYFSLKDFSIF